MGHSEATKLLKVSHSIFVIESGLKSGSSVLSSIPAASIGLGNFIPLSEMGKTNQRGKTT